jgi:hypothetical protein
MLRRGASYEPDDGADGVDWLGADGVEAVLPPSVFSDLVAGCRLRKPMALPFG